MMRLTTLTDAQRAEMPGWRDQWISSAMSTRAMDDDDRAKTIAGLKGLYEAAGLPWHGRVVFVPSPFVLRIASGFAAGIWHARKNGAVDEAVDGAVDVAVGGAVRQAVGVAVDGAVRVAVVRAVVRAVDEAVDGAVRVAVVRAVDGAVRQAVDGAVGEAVDGAVDVAVGVAVDEAVCQAVDGAVGVAVDGAVDGAVRQAVRVDVVRAVVRAVDVAVVRAVGGAVVRAVGVAVDGAVNVAVDGAVNVAVRGAVRGAVDEAVNVAVNGAVNGAVRGAVRGAVDEAVNVAVNGAVNGAVDLSSSVVGVTPADIRAMAGRLGVGEFGLRCAQSAWRLEYLGAAWSGWAAYISFFRSVVGLDTVDFSKWAHMEDVIRHAGRVAMHADFCMVADRPEVMSVDAENRPHSDTGPYARWRDGTAIYRVHGVECPAWVIEHPERITTETIDAETNAEVRRVMIDKYGTARYLAEVGIVIDAGTDETGQPLTLYRRDVPDDEPIVMLRMLNSTPDADGTRRAYMRRVPPDLASADQWRAVLHPSKHGAIPAALRKVTSPNVAIEARNWVCRLLPGSRIDVQT